MTGLLVGCVSVCGGALLFATALCRVAARADQRARVMLHQWAADDNAA